MKRIVKHVKRMEKKTAKALRAFTRIDDELTGQNVALDTVVDEIEQEIERLANLRTQAQLSKRMNDGIIGRVRDFMGSDI